MRTRLRWGPAVLACALVAAACSRDDRGAGTEGPAAPATRVPNATTAAVAAPPTSTGAGTTAPASVVPSVIDLVAGARPAASARGARAEGTLVTPDGRTRTFRTYVPSGRPATGLPILVALHGGTGSGAQFELTSGLDALAEANGFVVVYPDGVGSRADPDAGRTWNAGACCGWAAAQNVDDVGFVGRLVDEVARRSGADADRVVVAGHSNGAMMAHRLACELADRIVAVGGQAGALEISACRPARPVSVVHLHGEADTNVPIGGGVGSGLSGVAFRPLSQTMAMQAAAQGCGATPTAGVTSDPEVRVQTWAPCAGTAVVRLVLVRDAPHTWMRVGAPARAGEPPARLDAGRVLVSFLLDALARR